ncbi:MAG TPA: ankyrin repeat domain-containing protein [Steroidobacteraceae bacterium]
MKLLCLMCAAGLLVGLIGHTPAALSQQVAAEGGEGLTPLIVAAMSTRPEMVESLLRQGADVHRVATDPAIGNALSAAFFGRNGVELSGRSDEPDPRKHAAALQVVKLLAAARSNMNVLVTRGPTRVSVLMMAAQAGALDAVGILLEAGADPNFANGGKYTALDYAVDRPPPWSQVVAADRAEIVRLLLARGAKTQSKGVDGVSMIERARRGGNTEVLAVLMKAP